MTEPTSPPPGGRATEEPAADEVEILDALPVLAEIRPVAPAHPPAAVALAQTAAVAATGFFAGVATAAVLGRRRQRRLGRPAGTAGAARPGGTLEVVSSRSYLVDVHVLERHG